MDFIRELPIVFVCDELVSWPAWGVAGVNVCPRDESNSPEVNRHRISFFLIARLRIQVFVSLIVFDWAIGIVACALLVH
jgi:hypothetical protein